MLEWIKSWSRQDTKWVFMMMGILLPVSECFVMLWAVLVAYANPSKTVLIRINTYGEAEWDVIVMVFVIAAGMLSAFLLSKQLQLPDD